MAMIVRGVLMYFLFSTIGSFLLPRLLGTSSPASTGNATAAVTTLYGGIVVPPGKTMPTRCAFGPGDALTLFVYLSHNGTHFDPDDDGSQLVWKQAGLKYDWSSSNVRDENVTVAVSPRMLANESVYAHVFLVKAKGGNDTMPRPGTHVS
jgi:hypothetical protein